VLFRSRRHRLKSPITEISLAQLVLHERNTMHVINEACLEQAQDLGPP